MSRWLLCTDLDRTLLPNGAQPESPLARARFGQLVDRGDTTLAYVTGRDRVLVEEVIAEFGLPRPDWVIGDVGTTIYAVGEAGAWRPWSGWSEQIDQDWSGQAQSDLARLLRDVHGLRRQEAYRQNRHKLSFYHPLTADIPSLEALVESRLQAAGISTRLVWSVDEPEQMGLLDILPASASKLHAIRALMERLETDVTDTVFSGDSGNDLEVLVSDIPAVLVANASDPVREQALAAARAEGNTGRLYLARGGFLGMNGNYAAGILEGVAHFRPDLRDWMESRWEATV